MTKQLSICLLFAASLSAAGLSGQSKDSKNTSQSFDMSVRTELKTLKKEYFRDYSRWSIEAGIGMPFFSGDINSLSADKTYIGGQYGLRLGYQISPTLGLGLSGTYGRNKAGSPDYAKDYILGLDGMTYYPPTTIEGTKYADIYSRIDVLDFGLHLNLNLNNLFVENRGQHVFTVLLQPAVYLQKFSPKVYKKSGGRATTGSLDNSVNFGAGGDIAFRFRTGRLLDLQFNTGIIWISNNSFDGVVTIAKARDSYMWNAGLTAIFKLNGRKHKDNLIYAPSASYLYGRKLRRELSRADTDILAQKTQNAALRSEADSLKAEIARTINREKIVEKVVVKDTLVFPSIFFRTNSSAVDTQLYSRELTEIVALLKDNPDTRILVEGYADHTGHTTGNLPLSRKRAQSVVDYLVSQGISPSRLTAVGRGNDMKTAGANKVSILARRADLTQQKSAE